MNAWGPGDVILMHFRISFWMSLLVRDVSNMPGVSTMRILWSKRTADSCKHFVVTDFPDGPDINSFSPRMVFPVALFPEPVLPISTILISSFHDFKPNKYIVNFRY